MTPEALTRNPTRRSRGRPGGWLAAAVLLATNLVWTSLQAGTDPAKSGGWRLAQESSPYLQLHAENPVEWYPWGPEAFEKARRENKPLFISIGYFTCHWCHVMARESFSNPAIARLLNEHFVAIKVDREQRPDVDAAYMSYVRLTRGQGGWPLSVWATPEGDPFLGSTYLPPESAQGRSGMKQVLTRLIEHWRRDEAGVRQTAGRAVSQMRGLEAAVKPLARLTEETLAKARRQYAGSYDEFHGGFSPAPKFPQPARLLFLLQDTQPGSVDMALHTLDQMTAGGIYDHLEGGLHRYSTDFEWRVPHFEKMLYDQALVARACLAAYRRSREEPYAVTAREILDFTLRQMRDAGGGFYSALSADSPASDSRGGHMQEGAYYTWSWEQLTAALGEGELRDWAAARYGLTEAGNALSDPLGEMAGRNVLYLQQSTEELARQFGLEHPAALRRNAEVERRLLRARQRRPAVPVDDKVVTAWNGYMITALALAGRALDEPRYLAAAAATARFILDALYDEDDGVLYRDWRQGERGVPGFSDDYAALIEGLLALYRVSGEKVWLTRAHRLADGLIANFWDERQGGFFRTRADTELWLREKEAADGPTLSVNGIAIHALLDLGRFSGDASLAARARKAAAWAGAQLEDSPAAMSYSLIRWPELLDPVEPPIRRR